MGMATIALMRNAPRLVAALLVGFVGLLRTGKILGLTKGVFAVHGENKLLLISLPDTKSGFGRGETEHVLIHDKGVVELVDKVVGRMAPGERLFDLACGVFAKEIRDLAACFGIRLLTKGWSHMAFSDIP